MGLRETILAAQDRKKIEVEVPEWGAKVFIQSSSPAERDAIEQYILKSQKSNAPINGRALVAALIIVDENGKRVFSDDDVPALADKSAIAMERIFDAYVKINGLSKSERDEYEKNSSTTPSSK